MSEHTRSAGFAHRSGVWGEHDGVMTSLSLGVHVGQQNAAMDELVALWKRLDGAVDWISLWDHLYEAPPAGGTTPHYEAVATLGALASVTEHARLGCLMFCVPYRNPALLAKACVAIDHISGGRFEPGFGAGWHEPEFRAHGYDFDDVGVRFDMLGEGLEIISSMLAGGEPGRPRNHDRDRRALPRRRGHLRARPVRWRRHATVDRWSRTHPNAGERSPVLLGLERAVRRSAGVPPPQRPARRGV